jgi:hypothetical protein
VVVTAAAGDSAARGTQMIHRGGPNCRLDVNKQVR